MPSGQQSMDKIVEKKVQERLKRYAELESGHKKSMSVQLRILERAYQAVVAEEVRISMLAISRSAGAHADHVWEAAAKWHVPISVENQDFVVPYLEVWGYAVDDVNNWRLAPCSSRPDSGPQVTFTFDTEGGGCGHEEHAGHTWYMVSCHLRCLAESGVPLQGDVPLVGRSRMMVRAEDHELRWRAPRRLSQLREALHDPVKEALGSADYAAIFGETPFAKHGAPRGTTARLGAWLASLANAINNGKLPPRSVARCLSFFRGPPEVTEDDVQSPAAGGAGAPAPGPAVAAPAGAPEPLPEDGAEYQHHTDGEAGDAAEDSEPDQQEVDLDNLAAAAAAAPAGEAAAADGAGTGFAAMAAEEMQHELAGVTI